MSDSCCDTDAECGCDVDCSNIPEHKMCRMTLPMNKFDLEKVKMLTSDPKHICRCCGRTANDKENLCNPIPLHE